MYMKTLDAIKRILTDDSGETMLEMVISVAIFALMITFTTTTFVAANSIEAANYDARNDMNARFSAVCNANPDDDASLKGLNVSGDYTITFEIRYGDGTREAGQFQARTISEKVGDYEKIVEAK